MARSQLNVWWFAAALGLLATSGIVTAQKRPPMVDFTATGKWTVDYAANLCVLGRNMVSGQRRFRFSIRPALNTNGADIRIIEPAPKHRVLYGYPFVRFSDGSQAETSGRRVWRDGNSWTIVGVDRAALSPLEKAGAHVEVWFGDRYYRLFPGDMTKANAALAACERDLLKLMGMSQAEQDAMAFPPVYPKVGPLRHEDYPEALLQRDIEATMGLLLDVAADGRVTGCKAMESSGIAAFDLYACEIFKKRGKYGPALDKQGRPMRALTYTTVRWLIEPSTWGKRYKKPK